MLKAYIIIILIVNLLPLNPALKENISRQLFPAQTETTVAEKQVLTTEIHPLPQKIIEEKFDLGKANLSIDLESGVVLNEKSADERLEIASLTKLMTAYLTLRDLDMDKVITVPKVIIQPDDSRMGLGEGESLTVRNALYGLLLNSGGDAAQALAVADSGSVPEFVAKMNKTAQDLELTNTHFANPVGWDDKENYSSARDLASLSRILLRNKDFAEIIKTKDRVVYSATGRAINLVNTNVLLSDPNFVGLKTGFTLSAGECLITVNKKGNQSILTVILGSTDRFGQTKQYLDWIYNHFLW